ncbi:unnamed protein product [Hydatigera taeniaeformis]|uniref:Zf-3CxxC domain-containing protein n=1 Tax=Hydatigena taeniaeformis TaxID=6205 RepID=A0A0R3X0H7_HYDTA|nr:unnamed protein product [Hydatigera taeniaeformis]
MPCYEMVSCFQCSTCVITWISGAICPRCYSLKSRFGDPKPCTICQLPMAFGSALVCQRCLHYRTKFGDPRQCEKCLHMCAFYKDEVTTLLFPFTLQHLIKDLSAVKRPKAEEYTSRHTSNRSGNSTNYRYVATAPFVFRMHFLQTSYLG